VAAALEQRFQGYIKLLSVYAFLNGPPRIPVSIPGETEARSTSLTLGFCFFFYKAQRQRQLYNRTCVNNKRSKEASQPGADHVHPKH